MESNQTTSPFRGGEPVEGWLYSGIIAFAIIYGVVTLAGAFFLFYRRNHRLIKARGAPTLITPLVFNTYMVSITCASYLLGKTPLMCQILSYTYTFYLPFSALVYMMMFPSIVFADKLNSMKATRVAGEDNGWHWKLRHLITPKFKFLFSFVGGVIQCAVFIALQYGGVVLPGGEEGISPPGEELDCYRESLIVNSAFVMFYTLALGYFNMQLNKVEDPFYIKNELVFLTLIYTPLTLITTIYPIAPQIFPAGFDYRWVPVTASAVGFFFAAFLPLLMTIRPVEDWVEYKIYCFKKWRRGEANSLLEMESTESTVFALSQGVEVFKAVLENPTLLAAFTEFAVQNWSVENVLFYKEVDMLKNLFPTMTASERLRKAQSIVDEFVVMGAPLEVNLEYNTRMTLVKTVKSGTVAENTFNAAQKHIYELMKKDSFEKWQKTSEYRKAVEKSLHKRGSRSYDRTNSASNSHLPLGSGMTTYSEF